MKAAAQNETAKRHFLEEGGTDWRVSVFALALALLAHAAAFVALPASFTAAADRPWIDELELEILPPQLEEPKPALPEYVEANPDANMERPERETNQESFQDQQAAQENPDPESADQLPDVKGEIEDSKKIVSGNFNEQTLPGAMEKVFETLDRPLERPWDGDAQANPPPPQAEHGGNAAISSQPNESGTGSDASNASPTATAEENDDGEVPPALPGAKQTEAAPAENTAEEETKNAEAGNTEIPVAEMELPKPAARKTVITRTPPGPLANTNMMANKTGIVAVDSKFSEFGAYQQRMVEAIARQWHLLAERYDLGALYNTRVTVEFFLDHEGEITSYKTIFNTSSVTGKNLCEQAILSTAPYGPWTREMRALFGDQEQSVKFNFYYK